MKLLTSIILTAYLGYVVGVYTNFPWWFFVFSSALIALAIRQSAFTTFFAGFAGMFLLWLILAFFKDAANEHLLSQKVAPMLSMGHSSALLILVTGLVGGLVSGMGALTGYHVRRIARAIVSINLE
jgi:hypothetical protein